MAVTITTSSGRQVDVMLSEIEAAIGITIGDTLAAIDDQWSRITERTIEQHVDADGLAFPPYADGPFYWYPFGSKGKQSKAIRAKLRQLGESLPGAKHAGAGIRFASYEAFKISLGRTGVDLVGATEPHMMGSVERYVNGQFVNVKRVNYDQLRGPGRHAELLISGEKARLANIHNEGGGRMPRRHFYAFGAGDDKKVADLLLTRIRGRIRKL